VKYSPKIGRLVTLVKALKSSSQYETEAQKIQPRIQNQVVLEALNERLTLSELAQKYELHPNQITLWKREFLDRAPDVFSKGLSYKLWYYHTIFTFLSWTYNIK